MSNRRPSETYRTYGRGRSVRLDRATYSMPGTLYFVTLCCNARRRDLAHQEVARVVMDTWHEVTAARGYRLWALCIMPDHLHVLLELCGQDKDAASGAGAKTPDTRSGATQEERVVPDGAGAKTPDTRSGATEKENVASGLVPDGAGAKTPDARSGATQGERVASQKEPEEVVRAERREPAGAYPLGDVVREVKGRSLLGVRGVGRIRWQARFYDHVVRDFEDPTEIARYMVNNPVRAEMVEDWTQWPWIYVDPALVL